MEKQIDFSRYRRVSENTEVERQQQPQQPRASFFQRSQEREARSEFSGGRMAGGTWGGRSRSEGEQP